MFNEIGKHISNRSKVISLQYGVGEIVGCFNMYDGVDDYLEVEYFIDGKTRYFCTEHINDVRLLSSKKDIAYALNLMSEKLNDNSIANDFHNGATKFLDKNVLLIVRRIVELFRKNELTSKDNNLLYSTLDSLIYEVKEVYGVDHNCARGIVSDYLKCA